MTEILRLTEEEQDAAGRVMLEAALVALGEFPSDNEDRDDFTRRVVRSLAAAYAAEKSEERRLSESKGWHVFLETEAHEAVATAFWLWSEQVDIDICDVAAASVAGSRYLGLAQGLAAARAMTEALDMLEEGSVFAFSGRGAEHLAPKDKP